MTNSCAALFFHTHYYYWHIIIVNIIVDINMLKTSDNTMMSGFATLEIFRGMLLRHNRLGCKRKHERRSKPVSLLISYEHHFSMNPIFQHKTFCRYTRSANVTSCPNESIHVVVVVVVFTLKAVPVSTQYFLTSVLVQLTRTPSVVTG